MYSNDRGFGIRDLIIKIIFLALFVFLMIWLFRSYVPNMTPFYSNVFRENISYMQDASRSYFTTDKLPTEIGKSTKLTLKEMQDLNLVLPFVDKDGKSCNINESYAEVTKEENGYSLKVYLDCNEEKDFIVEVLGCYDYGCEDCSSEKEKNTAIEYEFKKVFSKDVTTSKCPSGYSNSDGKNCYKNGETVAAQKNYTSGYTLAFGVLYTTGSTQKVSLTPTCKTTSYTEKKYVNPIKETITTGSCETVEKPDPNCTVECKTKFVDGEYIVICNSCGTIEYEDCSSLKEETKYRCPHDIDGSTGSGENLKCYYLINKTKTECKCPNGTEEQTGSGTSLKCYKYITEAKVPYCKNENAVYDEKTNKCYLTVGSQFSHYSCLNSNYKLNASKGTCLEILKKELIVKTEKKTWTETKWSRSKTLNGWTATGKTRIVVID